MKITKQTFSLLATIAIASSVQGALISDVTSHLNEDATSLTSPYGSGLKFRSLELGAYVDENDTEYYLTDTFKVTLTAGQVFGGKAAYDPQYSVNELDKDAEFCFVHVLVSGGNLSGQTTLLSLDIGPKQANFPLRTWLPWSFEASSSGTYEFTYEVAGLGIKSTYGLFALPGTPNVPVPEPSTWVAGALMGLAFLPSLRHLSRRNASSRRED